MDIKKKTDEKRSETMNEEMKKFLEEIKDVKEFTKKTTLSQRKLIEAVNEAEKDVR